MKWTYFFHVCCHSGQNSPVLLTLQQRATAFNVISMSMVTSANQLCHTVVPVSRWISHMVFTAWVIGSKSHLAYYTSCVRYSIHIKSCAGWHFFYLPESTDLFIYFICAEGNIYQRFSTSVAQLRNRTVLTPGNGNA